MKRVAFIVRFYLVATLWFLTVLAIVLALMGPLRSVHAAVDMDVAVRTALLMALAMALASTVAVVAWKRLPLRGLTADTSADDLGHPLATPAGTGPATSSRG